MLPDVLLKGTALFTKKTDLNSLLITGCLFHFGQAVWRQARSKTLPMKYREDEHFRLNVKKLIAHAFVPVGDVTAAFNLVSDDSTMMQTIY